MPNRHWLAHIALAAALGWLPAAAACLRFEPTPVSISGRLVRQTFPGSPNYASASSGDKPETYWLIELDKAVCVMGTQGSGDPNADSVSNVRSIQLVVAPEVYTSQQGLLGKQVTATGTLAHGISGHHHTDVLLTVATLGEAQ